MASPQPDAPVSVPAHEQLPLGARWRGSHRYATGRLLVFSGVFTIFLVPPVGVVLLAVGAWLAWQGHRLRTQRIPVWPRSVPEERRGDPPGGAAVHKLVRQHSQFVRHGNGGDGAFAAWGEVLAELGNRYDSETVRVLVHGQPVAYFSLDWKELAHDWLHVAGWRSLVVPVVVRWWDQDEVVWAFGSMADAESFAAWATRKDHG